MPRLQIQKILPFKLLGLTKLIAKVLRDKTIMKAWYEKLRIKTNVSVIALPLFMKEITSFHQEHILKPSQQMAHLNSMSLFQMYKKGLP